MSTLVYKDDVCVCSDVSLFLNIILFRSLKRSGLLNIRHVIIDLIILIDVT